MMAAVPKAIRSAELRIGSLVLHCHVLDDGQRIVDAEDVVAFLRWLEDPCAASAEVHSFAEAFGKWLRGEDGGP